MTAITIPESYNYIGLFATFACNLKCSYCLNNQRGSKPHYKLLPWQEMVEGLNRIRTRPDLPITIQGGEPTCHPEFYKIVNGIDTSINLDLLTNGMFDVDEFMDKIPPTRFKREAPYASIRMSYHLEKMEVSPLIDKVHKLLGGGYSVGVWIVENPADVEFLQVVQRLLLSEGIDCRMKEYLGYYKKEFYGTYKYPKAVDGRAKYALCKPSEVLIAPDGSIHRCHYELYNMKENYAHISDEPCIIATAYMPCNTYGLCNSCDIKLKTNRFQIGGHCSVEVDEK